MKNKQKTLQPDEIISHELQGIQEALIEPSILSIVSEAAKAAQEQMWYMSDLVESMRKPFGVLTSLVDTINKANDSMYSVLGPIAESIMKADTSISISYFANLPKPYMYEQMNFAPIRNIQAENISEIRLEVKTIRRDVNNMDTFLRDDLKRKDEMLNDLLNLQRTGNTKGKIEKYYDADNGILYFDNVPLSGSFKKNQEKLMKNLFRNGKPKKKPVLYMDLPDNRDLDTKEQRQQAAVVYYHTARRINDRIFKETGIDRFLIYTDIQASINPAI